MCWRFYELARLLFGKRRRAMLAFFAAVAVTMSVSDIGGYGLAMLMGIPSMWSIKWCCAAFWLQQRALCWPLSCSACAVRTWRRRQPRINRGGHRNAVCMLSQVLDLPEGEGVAAGDAAWRLDERDIKQDNPTEQELRAWHEKSGLPLKRFLIRAACSIRHWGSRISCRL